MAAYFRTVLICFIQPKLSGVTRVLGARGPKKMLCNGVQVPEQGGNQTQKLLQ